VMILVPAFSPASITRIDWPEVPAGSVTLKAEDEVSHITQMFRSVLPVRSMLVFVAVKTVGAVAPVASLSERLAIS